MSLEGDIQHHRQLLKDEWGRVDQPTVAHVPAETEAINLADYIEDEWQPTPTVVAEVTDSGELGGPPFSPSMNRHLGPPAGYGSQRPWSNSFFYLRRACRNDHPGHLERPEFGGSLCHQLVSYAIVSGYAADTISRLMLIPEEDVSRHLKRALRWIGEDMDRKERIRNSRDPLPSEEPTPSRLSILVCDSVNRAVENFPLEERIWNSHRLIHPDLNLSTWEDEWARRQLALLNHRQECDRCRRVA